jgi:hypothetical protein
MNASLFEQTRMAELQQATRDYADAKQNYQRLVRSSLQEPDSAQRAIDMKAIGAENARLVNIVKGLMSAWSEGDLEQNELAKQRVIDLENELANFEEQTSRIAGKRDIIDQLKTVLATLMNENTSTKKTYYGYIVAILVLLIVVFIFFVYSYASTVVSTVTSAVESVTAPVTETVTQNL